MGLFSNPDALKRRVDKERWTFAFEAPDGDGWLIRATNSGSIPSTLSLDSMSFPRVENAKTQLSIIDGAGPFLNPGKSLILRFSVTLDGEPQLAGGDLHLNWASHPSELNIAEIMLAVIRLHSLEPRQS